MSRSPLTSKVRLRERRRDLDAGPAVRAPRHRQRLSRAHDPQRRREAERTRYESLARITLGNVGYEKAYAEGAGPSLEEAIIEALRL